MHTRCVTGLLLCGFLAASGAVLAADPPPAGQCFVAAMKAGDADAVAACYVEDGIIWFPGGPMAQGRPAIRDGFAHYFSEHEIKDASLSQMGESASDDTRTAWGTYAITAVHKATQTASVETGRYVDLQKLVDGKWLYVVDHPSGDPAPVADDATP
ncbi:nuclear transport factor 2 family protein [Luteimonas sp. MC1828]|uniref:YybH family protein n=1 Tax=Luteimonas sp. MC1828 TaxID=2799787 RepID=UPI0018F1585D|nr:nuclear transport factor 2 family protein [Luteimonas sp. MC1828]MBJ7573826.1 nuclear transport factor 2 family protein [Luteimonas sp. MC1828]